MSFHRATYVAIATLFTVGIACIGTSSAASACGGWGGWSGWGGGCGGTSYAPTTYAVPVTTYVQPLAPAPIEVGGCGCRNTATYGVLSVAPTPVYVVNQGPNYVGPGLMEPYRTYNPATAYAPAAAYPYISGYRTHRYGARYAFGAHGYHAHAYGPRFYRQSPHWHVYR